MVAHRLGIHVQKINKINVFFKIYFSIQGDIEYTHRGDRSRDGIIEFAKRALGCVSYFVKRYSNNGQIASSIMFNMSNSKKHCVPSG